MVNQVKIFVNEKEVRNEVKGINTEITKEERSKRRDLTGLDIITIDGEDAKDLFFWTVYVHENGEEEKL